MRPLLPEHQPPFVPAPCLALTAWLLKPLRSIGPEVDDELRQSCMRRLDSILASAAISLGVALLAAFRWPHLAVVWWLVFDLALGAIRVPLLVHLLMSYRAGTAQGVFRAWMVDLFVIVGTLWSALVGIGCALCLATDDPGLSILAVLVAVGTIGGQGVRSPGSPRLSIVQMCAVIVPLNCGLAVSSIPMTGWAMILTPPYLYGMISITRQLHLDYERMIVARFENRRRALHCPLTGLPNRTLFADSLAQALKALTERRGEVTVMYLDLDGFKAVNDTLGHAIGDELLTQVAARLRDSPLGDAVVARIGGDEFAILLRWHARRQTEAAAQDVIDALARPYEVGEGVTVRVGVSIGLATGNADTGATALLRDADEALYAAKRDGRGIFRWSSNPRAAPFAPTETLATAA